MRKIAASMPNTLLTTPEDICLTAAPVVGAAVVLAALGELPVELADLAVVVVVDPALE